MNLLSGARPLMLGSPVDALHSAWLKQIDRVKYAPFQDALTNSTQKQVHLMFIELFSLVNTHCISIIP